jgi:hypothetical protein
MNPIKLNEILRLNNLEDVKIRFNLQFEQNWDPIEYFKKRDLARMLDGHYWNYAQRKSYKIGQISVGLVKIKSNEDFWLLFHIGRTTKDLNVYNGVGYEYESLPEYENLCGRLIVKYHNKSQMLIPNAKTVIDECYVAQILPDAFDNDVFPGYEKVNISWEELTRVIEKDNWKTALQNQKGVYLMTDASNGKKYVGSAYGENMILGRWKDYAKNGHGGNVGLKGLPFDHIKKHFRYAILDIYKFTAADQLILDREGWWKDILLTRNHGYNKN